jgi:cytoskeleton protein RodZ
VQTDDKEKASVGASLAAAREALGITQIEAADALNLTQRTIAALETDDYDNLPGWVYASGYIRAYARMLGLDADELVRRSTELRKEAEASAPQSEEVERAPRHQVNKMPIQLSLKQWGYVGLGVLGVALFISFLDEIPPPQKRDQITTQQVEEPSAQASTVEKEPSAQALSADKEPSAQASTVEKEPSAQATSVGREPSAQASTVEKEPSAQATSVGREPSALTTSAGREPSAQAPSAGKEPSAQASTVEKEPSAQAPSAGKEPSAQALPADKEPSNQGSSSQEATIQEPADEEVSVEEAADRALEDEYRVPYFGEDETGARKLSQAGDQQLRLEFAADCWIEIRDTDDNLLYADLGRAGQVRRFVGDGPFALKLGFSEGVRLYFNAEPIDLAPHTRNQMARLELGQ